MNFANLNIVSHAHFVHRQPQKKGISPATIKQNQLKCVNNVSCVDQLCFVKLAPNVPNVVQNLPVGARLNQFWETWETLWAGLKVVQMLKEGYTLPFQTRPNLTKSPTIISCYVNPHRNLYLLEALHQLTNKNTIELVKISGLLQLAIFCPKTKQQMRPILDLSNLNKFLKVEKFKMETPKTIRTSLQTGVWVMSIDFKNAYFLIPIQNQSRKYLRFMYRTKHNSKHYPSVCPQPHWSLGLWPKRSN